MRAAADARRGAADVRRARRSRAGRARVGDGVRVRRLLRLCRADARGLRAAVPGGTGARRRGARDGLGGALSVSFCGLELEHPIVNGSGTFDAVAARRAFGGALLDRFPFAAFVTKTVTVAPRRGNPTPRLWEPAVWTNTAIGMPNKGIELIVPV